MDQENNDGVLADYAASLIKVEPMPVVLRKHPNWIFHHTARPNPHQLAGFFLSQLTLLGARDVQVKRVDDWYIFTADIDWMTIALVQDCALLEQFERWIIFPEDGQNAMRYEAAIQAFSQAVIIADQKQVTVVSGEVEDDNEIWKHITTEYPRTLAFLFPFSGRPFPYPQDESQQD
ncbi:hypothetical protein [Deinococcus roseus]|uniref:Uncharacterized protein n=1 Tax=Deinococcus roseus TaxID=392414 RepID=A0ABQ2D6A7_9DEIO|nr:hypothetical protein [Deinococcus roseus]GGJ47610.1 hypothetical protein GCM10008938_37000 [Deinococcus roseus]